MAFYDLMFNRCRLSEEVAKLLATRTKCATAEDDFAVPHCLQHWPGGHGWADINIFRFDEHGKIVEHWDAGSSFVFRQQQNHVLISQQIFPRKDACKHWLERPLVLGREPAKPHVFSVIRKVGALLE